MDDMTEGPRPLFRLIYRSQSLVAPDERREGLGEQAVGERAFGRWAMARVSDDGGADIRLMSNASKGVIVAVGTADPSIDAGQEQLLAFMRTSLAHDPA